MKVCILLGPVFLCQAVHMDPWSSWKSHDSNNCRFGQVILTEAAITLFLLFHLLFSCVLELIFVDHTQFSLRKKILAFLSGALCWYFICVCVCCRFKYKILSWFIFCFSYLGGGNHRCNNSFYFLTNRKCLVNQQNFILFYCHFQLIISFLLRDYRYSS